MITVNVPEDDPLTPGENGVVVWVILNETNVVGVYCTPERAWQYIKSWAAGKFPLELHRYSDTWEVTSNRAKMYSIRRTILRF